MINEIHSEIKDFIGDFSEQNIVSHKMGNILVFASKYPRVIIFFISNKIKTECFISYNKKKYTEEEFLRALRLKLFF